VRRGGRAGAAPVSIFEYWPNRITAMRLGGSAVLFTLLAAYDGRAPSEIHGVVHFMFWLFVVTAATDFLDGWLARRSNQVSAFGRVADPFCDKILILGSMIFLSVMRWDPQGRSLFPAWVVVVILAREFLVTGIRGYSESLGVQFPADLFGKLKMGVQCVAVGELLWIYSFDWSRVTWFGLDWYAVWWWIGRLLVLGTLVTTVLSGLNYVLKSKGLLVSSGE
jgi:CDP-diacylglycerol---glycerol-3-phosphate 3-phosphatidyltransferase